MARKDRLIEEVKLAGLALAVGIGLEVAVIGGVLGLILPRHALLTEYAVWSGLVVIGVSFGILIATMLYLAMKLRALERE
jgi:protein-S-isoprenylcysteine O-methyltransferase Ste14